MFNYRLRRLNAMSVFNVVTLISLVFGGFWGLIFFLLERSVLGLLGGFFFTLIFGFLNGITSALSALLYNHLAARYEGIEILLERKDAYLDSLDQPIPLVKQPCNCQNSSDAEIKP